jgi:hypothetical protein
MNEPNDLREHHCAWCGEPFVPVVDGQKHCCRAHSDAYYAAERRAAVKFFRASGQSVKRKDEQVAVGQ